MVNTMFVLDRTLNTSHILSANKNSQSAFWEDTYTQEFDTGAESFEFSCYTHESIKEGNYVAFFYNNQYKMFQIIEVQEVHKKGRLVSECYCEIASLQLLNNYVKPFSGDMNCIQFFQHILHGTEWHIGKYSTSLENVVYTVNESNIESVWSLIEDYKDIYGCEINVRVTYDNGHVTGQYIDIYAEGGLGSSTFKRFEYGVNVTGITKTKDLYDWCTGIILDVECDVSDTVIEERDGYGFTKGAGDVILDDNANRMYNAGRTHVIGVYQGKETEPVEACINAWKELQKRKEPKFDYKVTTALKDEEYEDIHLGDTVYVVDHSYTPPLLLEARVGKLELSFTDRTQNSCTLTNYKEIKSKLLDADYIKLTGTITDVVNAFFPITSEGIADGAIVDGKIETTYFQQITADIVSAGIGAFENLYAQGLTVINADIERLNATTADITELKAQVADIDTLINGHLTSDNIQSMIITGDKFTVADGFIKNAMIDNITADKITTGSINTDNVYISSEDGSMIINGNLQQFKDKDGNVRIQIGKDAQGDFTFSLFDENGTGVLIDEKGITENAIADGLIVNDMVAENAGIAGSKLDIDSVVTEINEGATTIKGTKVVLDDTNQTLDVAFNILNTKVDDMEEEVTSNTTAINVQQGQIDTLISNTTITKGNGEVVQLKDEYNSTKDTVDSHTTKIGSLETAVDGVTSKQASMELDLNGFRTEVSDTYVTKEEINLTNYNLINNGKFQNCYVNTFDMIPSWECDDELQVYDIPSNSSEGWIKLYNRTSESGLPKSIQQRVNLEDGEMYTLTFKAGWQENVNRGVMCYIGYYDSSDSRIYTINIPIENQIDNADELQDFTFTTPTNLNYEYIVLKFRIGDTVNSGGNYIYGAIGDVKLEKGGTYTGWRGSKYDEATIIEGPNLVKNGDFSSFTLPRTIDDWIIGGDGYIWDSTGQDGYNKEGCMYFAHTSLEDVYSGFWQPIYNLKKRTEYTLTFYIDWESNVRSFYVNLHFYGNNGTLVNIDLKPSHQGIWSYTFVTPDIDFYGMDVNVCHRGIKADTSGGFLGTVGNVKLTEKVLAEDLGTVLSNYTTKTEFQQSNEDFTFKIQQAGGYNLLKNSSFTNGTEYWTKLCWDGTHTGSNNLHVMNAYETWNNNHFNGLEYLAHITQPQGYVRGGFDSPHVYNLEPNAHYSFSCYASCGRVDELTIEICGNDFDENYQNWGTPWRGAIGSNTEYGTNYEGWTKVEFTFSAPSNAKYIFLRFWGNKHTEGSQSVSLMISRPCLVKGSIPLDWSPHASEIYDGVVKIDSRGLTVQHGNNHSTLDSEALKFYEGNQLYSKVDGGLFKVMKPGDSSTTVGSMGRFEWANSGTCCTCVSAGPGHDVSIGSVRTSGEATICNLVDSSQGGFLTGTDFYYDQGLNINRATCHLLNFKGSKSASFSSQAETNVGALSLWATTSTNSEGNHTHIGCIHGRDALQFGIAYGSLKCAMEICESSWPANNAVIHMYGPISMHNYPIYDAQNISTLSARSSYTQTLLNRGSNDLYSYNNCSYYQGEIRWCWKEPVFTYAEADVDTVTDEWVYTGRNICYIELPIFMAENIEENYHISIGKIGWGDYRIVEKNPYYFIIESQEEDFAFTFEVVAKLVDGQTLDNNVSIASMSTTANPSVSVEPPTTEEIILPGSENIWQSSVVVEDVEEEVIDNTQENINIGEE